MRQILVAFRKGVDDMRIWKVYFGYVLGVEFEFGLDITLDMSFGQFGV